MIVLTINTNINKINNHLSSQVLEYKKNHEHGIVILPVGPILGQAQKCVLFFFKFLV